jgi:hypothetical protein
MELQGVEDSDIYEVGSSEFGNIAEPNNAVETEVHRDPG